MALMLYAECMIYDFTTSSGAYRSLQIPVIVFACKSDLERKVDPLSACETLSQYDVGLVEVDHSDAGKDKMKRSFDFLLIAIVRERRNGNLMLSPVMTFTDS